MKLDKFSYHVGRSPGVPGFESDWVSTVNAQGHGTLENKQQVESICRRISLHESKLVKGYLNGFLVCQYNCGSRECGDLLQSAARNVEDQWRYICGGDISKELAGILMECEIAKLRS